MPVIVTSPDVPNELNKSGKCLTETIAKPYSSLQKTFLSILLLLICKTDSGAYHRQTIASEIKNKTHTWEK